METESSTGELVDVLAQMDSVARSLPEQRYGHASMNRKGLNIEGSLNDRDRLCERHELTRIIECASTE